MTYCAWACVQRGDLWRGEETKKGQKRSCIKLAICPDHPRLCRPLNFCTRGRIREIVIYFKFHKSVQRSRNCGVGGRKSPSPIDLADVLYNSLYYRTSRDSILGITAGLYFPVIKHNASISWCRIFGTEIEFWQILYRICRQSVVQGVP